MANMTIYVKDNNIWDEARKKAKTQGISFSAFIERAVVAYVHADSQQSKLDKIQAILNNDDNEPTPESLRRGDEANERRLNEVMNRGY